MNRRAKVVSIVLLAIGCLLVFANISSAISPEEQQKIENAVPAKAAAVPKQARKILVFNRCEGFKHESIPYVAKALEIMGQKTGAFEVVQSEDMAAFEAENLKKFDAICFNNSTRLAFTNAVYRENLMNFVKGGKGIVCIHGAVDNFYSWPEAAEMIGGQYDSHPWTSEGTWEVSIDDTASPIVNAFNGKPFKVNDEIYRLKTVNFRDKCHLLTSINMTDEANVSAPDVKFTDIGNPVSWVRNYGNGRVFCCTLGHNPSVFWNTAILQHYLDGIQFALGDLIADASASGPLNSEYKEAMYASVEETMLKASLSRAAKYDYGMSREPLSKLDDIVRLSYGSSQKRRNLEKKFIEFLQSDATLAGKQFICQKLSIVGTERAIPVLAGMLVNESTSDMARYAIERIPGAASDEALQNALNKASGKVKVGIINSIGQCGDAGAVSALGGLLSGADKDAALAAAAALGRIGNEEATKTLKKVLGSTSGDLHIAVANSYLMCADKLLKAGNKNSAQQIYKQMYIPAESVTTRIAALRGMVATSGEKAVDIVVDVLKKDEPKMQTVAIALVREIPGQEVTKKLTKIFNKLSVTSQVQLLAAFIDRGDAAALPAVIEAAKNTDESVRTEALKAVGKLGNSSQVKLLAETAATVGGTEQQTARDSLYRLRGADIDQTIINSIAQADSKVKVELIRSIGERSMNTAVTTLVKTAKDADPAVRLESLKVLKVVAGQERLPELIGVMVSAQSEVERSEAEKTVAAVARKVADKGQQSKAVLDALPAAKDVTAKCSLLNVLGKIGDNSALSVLQASLTDKDDAVKDTAIRALSEWPTAEPMANLLQVAQSSGNQVHRVLALRGYIRLIGLPSDRSAGETTELYQKAMGLASDVNEKKMVLSGLSNVKTFDAMKMASESLNNNDLRQEAEVAVVKIAESMLGTNTQQVVEILKNVVQTSKNDALRAQAQKLVNEVDKFKDYLTVWQVSGPYTKDNTECQKLFDIPFAPEEPGAKDVVWTAMPVGANAERPWLLELDKVFSGDNRVAYLRSKVWSEKTQKVIMEAGSDDGIKVWLNGQMILADNAVMQPCRPGQYKQEVTLKEGWNQLLLKITQGIGQWSACIRFRGLDGSELKGLRTDVGEVAGVQVKTEPAVQAKAEPSKTEQTVCTKSCPKDAIKKCQEAMDKASNADEKKAVLRTLADIKTLPAFEMASVYLNDENLRIEARAAVVKIAADIFGAYPAETQNVLEKVAQASTDDPVCKEAQKLLAMTKRFRDFLTAWEVSGPYTKEGAKGSDLFDVAFEPEKPDAKNVVWRIMPMGTNIAQPWLVEMDKVLGGDERVAYLRNKIWSDKTQRVELRAGSDDGIKIWLNGQVILADNAIMQACQPGQYKVEVMLKEGWNNMMVKITQGIGEWSTCIRFRNTDGSKVEGLKVQLQD